jgi:N-acetylglutamate synthase-like GNAT family acetyltransferase
MLGTANHFFVAESNSAVTGFAQFLRQSAQLVELTRIYVRPDRQRSGGGMRLPDALLRNSRERA